MKITVFCNHELKLVPWQLVSMQKKKTRFVAKKKKKTRFVAKKRNSFRGNSFRSEKKKALFVVTRFVAVKINSFSGNSNRGTRKKNSFRGDPTALVIKFDNGFSHEIIVFNRSVNRGQPLPLQLDT